MHLRFMSSTIPMSLTNGRRSKSAAAALGALVVLATSGLSAVADHDTWDHVSAGAINGSGDFPAVFEAASSDGTMVYFETFEKLATSDTDDARDVYLRSGGTTTQVSLGTINGNGAIDAFLYSISLDGTKAWFDTSEALLPGDGDPAKDVYERSGGTTTRISVGSTNDDSTEAAFFAGASADGSKVFFTTEAQFVLADVDDAEDIYLRQGNSTTLISKGAINGNGDFGVSFEDVSADGARVFFTTDEPLVAGDTDAQTDVYRRSGGTTKLMSKGPINGNGAFDASYAGISENGARVFFTTDEPLVAGDTDAYSDIYQRYAGRTKRISRGNGPHDVGFEAMSTNGRTVFFWTREQLRASDTDAELDVYSRRGRVVRHVSQGAINGNGAEDAWFAGASADGSRVFFYTAEPLAVGDSDASNDVYQRFGGVTTMLSFGAINGNGAYSSIFYGSSADGARVFFVTNEALSATDLDSTADIYERTSAGVTSHVSTGNAELTVSFNAVSTDGARVIFSTDESLVGSDGDTRADIYVAYPTP